ncbi:zinc-finger domain-containing protein [Roseococcus sp. YIM B11640]|uniref:zinc-finger domain-containing protein n=1 Tax=Roseococcus sp. YIM B11640 TaxID=3133973 RepID=UPI003C7BC890
MRDPELTGYTPNLTPGVTPDDVVMVDTRKVGCDGGHEGPLGHPLVYLRIEGEQVTCPYCSKTYRLREGAGDDGHH